MRRAQRTGCPLEKMPWLLTIPMAAAWFATSPKRWVWTCPACGLLLGAGGAARGILGPLLACAPQTLTVANRTPERAHALVTSYDASANLAACGLKDLGDASFDLILNATAAGLSDSPMNLPASILDVERTVCYDLMYGADTAFLAWARQAGCTRVCDGLGMLVEQAAESFELWHGVRPDTEPVRDRLRSAAKPRTA